MKVLQPAAPARDAVGREAYSLHSRSFLGTTVDLDETYAWGVKELESIIARQREVAEEIEPAPASSAPNSCSMKTRAAS